MYTKDRQLNLCHWFEGDTARLLYDLEKQAFERLTGQVFGYHLLQIGWLDENAPMLTDSRLQNQTLLGPMTRSGLKNFVAADTEQLPVMTDSVDAVLLPHTLDFSSDPQNVLREVERVLIPEGRVIISGFNPTSLWGIQRFFLKKSRRMPWDGHFVSYTRLHDWLSLLGFDVEETEVSFYRPHFENPRIISRLSFLEKIGSRFWPRFGSIYMIKAVKRVSRLTPIKPAWKRRPRLLAQVVEPTPRGMNSQRKN